MGEPIAIIAAVTALLAVIVGPLVTLRVADRQVRASTRSQFRQHWVEHLRDDLASFLGTLSLVAFHRATNNEERLDELGRELAHLEARLRLRLNENEASHAELAALLGGGLGTVFTAEPSAELGATMRKLEKEIVAKAQPIIKREWERVKALE